MQLKTLIKKLESIGVKKFTCAEELSDVTYFVSKDGVDINFWNIDRVIPCKYNSADLDLIPLDVRLIVTKAGRINANSYDHVLKDITEIDYHAINRLQDVMDLKALIYRHQSVGLKIVS